MQDRRSAQLFEFLPDGTFAREIGVNLPTMEWPHSVRIDRDDNIRVVDNGSDTVTKLDPKWRLVFVLGRRQALGEAELSPDSAPTQSKFNGVTAVAWDLAGNIYVSDRMNHRIQVFDTDGNFLRQISEPAKGGVGWLRSGTSERGLTEGGSRCGQTPCA